MMLSTYFTNSMETVWYNSVYINFRASMDYLGKAVFRFGEVMSFLGAVVRGPGIGN